MLLKSAVFDNFRNIEHQVFEFSPSMTILYGKNAQGKTNVIEGIYMFAGGKSFRHAKDADLRRFDSDITQVAISFEGGNRENKMTLRYSGTGKKELFSNGARVPRISEFIGKFKAVLFCPSHLSIVQADPAVRRSFIDGAISQLKPKYLSALYEYQKTVEQRNALLRNYEKNPVSFDMMFDVISENTARLAAYITAERCSYLNQLFGTAEGIIADMSFGRDMIGYVYQTSIGSGELYNEKENFEAYMQVISKYREKEKIVGTSLIGAQRDDFEIKLGGMPAKIFASQGQQRSIALSLKLAEGEISRSDIGEYPVFLFDDVLSELDRERKNYVLSNLRDRQVIVTTCDESDFKDIDDSTRIYVENGRYKYID